MKKIVKTLALSSVVALLAACSSSEEAPQQPVVEQTQEAPATPVDNTIYFPVNGYAVDEQYAPILDNEASYLVANPTVKVQVQGYTDKTGSAAYNMGLGKRRANAVKKYLVSKGVNSKQLSVKSFGKTNPAVEGDTPEDLAKNRRVILAK